MSLEDVLYTPRLVLIPVTGAIILAASRGRETLEALIGARVHEAWRGHHVFERRPPLLVDSLPRHALIVHGSDCMVIGEVRFEPQRAGEGVEIGYSVAPPYRRRGIATEATAAVMDALMARGAPYFVAGCAMSNRASVRTLRRLGFTLDGSSARGNAFWWIKDCG